jgi:hypothetical protein
MKVADESMSAWRLRTTALGGLTNISFLVPLGLNLKLLLAQLLE